MFQIKLGTDSVKHFGLIFIPVNNGFDLIPQKLDFSSQLLILVIGFLDLVSLVWIV